MNIFLINKIFYAQRASDKTQQRYSQYGKLQKNISIKNKLFVEICSQNFSAGERDSRWSLFSCNIPFFLLINFQSPLEETETSRMQFAVKQNP